MDAIMNIASDYLIGITLGSGSGTFTLGEEVYTGTTADKHAYGRVNAYTVPVVGAKSMRINKQEGVFEIGDIVVGLVSGASYAIAGIYDTTVRATHEDQQDNEQLELEQKRDNIFDFTETDPFSEGDY
jgi:hypothetical protein